MLKYKIAFIFKKGSLFQKYLGVLGIKMLEKPCSR